MSKSFYVLVTGIVIGILIAPEKGSRTRNKLSRKAQALRDKYRTMTGGSPVPPLARDSGLSTHISPEISGVS